MSNNPSRMTKNLIPLLLPLFLFSFSTSVFSQSAEKVVTDNQKNNRLLHDRDIVHTSRQLIRGIVPPKQYFEDKRIQRYAVVIGISDYKDPKIPDLKYADADAQAFYDFITSPVGGSFHKENVLLLKNNQATLKNIKLAITGFLRQATDSDFVMIFMACHGEPEPGRPDDLYLLTYDSKLNSLPATAYLMEHVNADMKRYISSRRLVFFADVCHGTGLTTSTIGTRGVSNTVNVALSTLKSTREGWGVVSASRASEVSMESNLWGGGHGVFTYYLLEGLKGKADEEGNRNGIVTLVEAFDFLEEKVKRATQNTQHPDTSGNFDNNLPLGFPGVKTSLKENEKITEIPCLGTLQITTNPEGASVYVDGKEVGTTPLNIKLMSGTYPITLKKRNCADVSDIVFINSDETTDAYIELINVEERELARANPATLHETQLEHTESMRSLEYAESPRNKVDIEKTKENIDTLIKELESMAKEQLKENKSKISKKTREKSPKPEEVPRVIPISVKEFSLKMGVLSNRRKMEKLRQKIIDALLDQEDLSVVERDLEFQEEILREQRLGSSVLADELFRIELGKIQGAAFLCFGGVSLGEASSRLVLRMEIVDTTTTLVDTLEHAFQGDENLRTVANDVAIKIKEKITAKRKL
ncbi:MAG: PEGA domain-containing protein [Candidatus Jettenia caeni]|nr:MAG: PEGA domain-containing protein [Candidatus Jettenia caeni]